MTRMPFLWATLALIAVVSFAEDAAACRRRCRPGCYRISCNPASSATIVVRLPADAKLFVDDHLTTSAGSTRRFVTPPLQPGREFRYTVKAEATRDGQTVTTEKAITVRAFSTTQVDFGDMMAAPPTSLSGFVVPPIEDLPEPNLPALPKVELSKN